jgi:hypothetical protein
MATESENAESSLEEQLVAYLDGELDAEAVRRIEERLASEPEVREALSRLERTWDLLDELGSTPVGESFTRTTLEMVTVAAEKDVEQVMAEAPRRRRRRMWLVGAGAFAAAAAGFLAVGLALPNSNRQLLEDLPLLESLEAYREIDDLDFLRLLQEKGLADSLLPADYSVKERPQADEMTAAAMVDWVKNMPAVDKTELLEKKKKLDTLPLAEQAKLRALHSEVQKSPDAAELRWIMREYYEWWKNLPPVAKNELSAPASPEERVKRLQQWREAELWLNPAIVLSEQDMGVLRDWLTGYFRKFEAKHREGLAVAERKKWDAQPKATREQKIAAIFFWRRGQLGGARTPMPEDLSELLERLSPETKRLLADKPPEEQWKRIQSWLGAIGRQQFAARAGRRSGSLVDENEVAEFFERLPDPEKMRLLDLTPEDMQHELQRLILMHKPPMQPFLGRPPDGPPPGGRPGPPHRPE